MGFGITAKLAKRIWESEVQRPNERSEESSEFGAYSFSINPLGLIIKVEPEASVSKALSIMDFATTFGFPNLSGTKLFIVDSCPIF